MVAQRDLRKGTRTIGCTFNKLEVRCSRCLPEVQRACAVVQLVQHHKLQRQMMRKGEGEYVKKTKRLNEAGTAVRPADLREGREIQIARERVIACVRARTRRRGRERIEKVNYCTWINSQSIKRTSQTL